MLNLLISIIGDTYDKVQEGQVVANTRELLYMVREIESLMYWKRTKKEKHFLHTCTSALKVEHDDDSWSGKIRQIYKTIVESERRVLHAVKEEISTLGTDFDKNLRKEVDVIKRDVEGV